MYFSTREIWHLDNSLLVTNLRSSNNCNCNLNYNLIIVDSFKNKTQLYFHCVMRDFEKPSLLLTVDKISSTSCAYFITKIFVRFFFWWNKMIDMHGIINWTLCRYNIAQYFIVISLNNAHHLFTWNNNSPLKWNSIPFHHYLQ